MGTRGQWAKDFLAIIGNANPSPKTINLVSAWTKAEGTEARFNPLATTLPYGNNTKFNTVGVRNYSTRQEGLEATAITLRGNHTGYGTVLKGLATDNPNLALDGMLTPGMPWGTNFGTVAVYYRTKDVTNEPLASEENTSIPIKGKADDTPVPKGTKTDYLHTSPITYTDSVSGDTVRVWAKMVIAVAVGISGAILIVLAVMKTDTVKSAVDIAKVAAI